MGGENSGNGSIGPCFPLSSGTAALDPSSTDAARLAGACDVGLVDALPATPPTQPVVSGSHVEIPMLWELSQKLDMLTIQEKQVIAFRETVRKVAKGLWDRLWRARPEAVAAAGWALHECVFLRAEEIVRGRPMLDPVPYFSVVGDRLIAAERAGIESSFRSWQCEWAALGSPDMSWTPGSKFSGDFERWHRRWTALLGGGDDPSYEKARIDFSFQCSPAGWEPEATSCCGACETGHLGPAAQRCRTIVLDLCAGSGVATLSATMSRHVDSATFVEREPSCAKLLAARFPTALRRWDLLYFDVREWLRQLDTFVGLAPPGCSRHFLVRIATNCQGHCGQNASWAEYRTVVIMAAYEIVKSLQEQKHARDFIEVLLENSGQIDGYGMRFLTELFRVPLYRANSRAVSPHRRLRTWGISNGPPHDLLVPGWRLRQEEWLGDTGLGTPLIAECGAVMEPLQRLHDGMRPVKAYARSQWILGKSTDLATLKRVLAEEGFAFDKLHDDTSESATLKAFKRKYHASDKLRDVIFLPSGSQREALLAWPPGWSWARGISPEESIDMQGNGWDLHIVLPLDHFLARRQCSDLPVLLERPEAEALFRDWHYSKFCSFSTAGALPEYKAFLRTCASRSASMEEEAKRAEPAELTQEQPGAASAAAAAMDAAALGAVVAATAAPTEAVLSAPFPAARFATPDRSPPRLSGFKRPIAACPGAVIPSPCRGRTIPSLPIM